VPPETQDFALACACQLTEGEHCLEVFG
jgi:hypothetical protein